MSTNSRRVSIFNDVLGPVMRGPSSSHTAASYRIGRLARDLLGDKPRAAEFTFDPDGSYAQVYRQQGSDLAFAAGLMGWDITDERFDQALDYAGCQGIELSFTCRPLPQADHPNCVDILATSSRGDVLRARAKSTGGGAIVFSRLDEWPVELTGDDHVLAVELEPAAESALERLLNSPSLAGGTRDRQQKNGRILLLIRQLAPFEPDVVASLKGWAGVRRVWTAQPLVFVKPGPPLFTSAQEMIGVAEQRRCSLGQVALAYESQLLGRPEDEIASEMRRRFQIMKDCVARGLDDQKTRLFLLPPSASKLLHAEANGRVAVGGLHTRAAARALAAMHTNCSGGVVCAAPTGGAAGVLPGVFVSLAEEQRLSDGEAVKALFAASAVGVIVATRATFAAEVAGCQVEIAAAGAMASAGVVEAAGGSARQACDAAAIAFQNAMGSVCDLVQGFVEIPCHTRNALAAAGAFVCADLILGGYENPVPLDETIDAVMSVGQMLPPELRCTGKGGLALCPSAQALPRLR